MSVKTEGQNSAFIIAVEDGHRTTITLGHDDALDLLAQMTDYYGKVELHTSPAEGKRKGFFGRIFSGS